MKANKTKPSVMGIEPVNTGVASGESAQLHVYHMGIGEKCQEMRQITKDIQINIDGSQTGFRLFKLDAFSGIMLLRLLMRLEEQGDGSPRYADAEPENRPRRSSPTYLDFIASLSEDELRSVMTAVLNHVSVLLPAGLQPVMTGPEWGYPELERDTPSCMKLLLEGIAWSLSGFFGEGQPGSPPAPADISP